MRKIKVTKTVEVVFEVDDDYFYNDDDLINFVRSSDCQEATREEGYPYNEYILDYDDVKDIKIYKPYDEKKEDGIIDEKNVERTITGEEYANVLRDMERSETCYECGGYGDDYDSDGNCLCEDCPYFEDKFPIVK